jgi:gliding motility-associated lipoprotein GldH
MPRLKTRNRRLAILGFALGLMLSSCDSSRVYETNIPVQNEAWPSSQWHVHEFETDDTVGLYNMYLNLRNHKTYPFANLYVFFHTYLPNGTYDKDTVQFILADPAGRWLGDVSGEYVNHRVLFRRKFHFPETGQYKFEIEQGMRDTTLEGIADVGLRIEKAN